MAEIANYLFFRHLRAEPSSHVIQYKNGRQRRSGRAASFWFRPLDTAVVEVPVDDRELSFIFHGRSADFQDVTVQGVLTYRVVEPALLAERVDFGIDLRNGRHLREPLEQLSDMLSALAQQFALDDIARAGVRELLIDGHERIRRRVREGLLADDALSGLGLELVAVRVAAIRPTADLEKALEAPTRETIQQAADEAGFARRALAVEKERAIAENELQNRIELAKREQGASIILVSHILDMVERVCDRVALQHEGRVARIFTRAELAENRQRGSSLEELYLDVVGLASDS